MLSPKAYITITQIRRSCLLPQVIITVSNDMGRTKISFCSNHFGMNACNRKRAFIILNLCTFLLDLLKCVGKHGAVSRVEHREIIHNDKSDTVFMIARNISV